MGQKQNASSWENARWAGITRPYAEQDVERLRGTVQIEYSLARNGAEKLWKLLHEEPCVPALGALTGNQAVEMASAGLKAIYLSGWQVAADANLSGQMYPDQSLYPANSVPNVVRAINNALLRADQIAHSEGRDTIDWMLPIVADAEAGFGGSLNAFELMKAMIEAGAAAAHFDDQSSSAKKCGHLGGKVLVPTQEAVQKLVAARLAAGALGVATLIVSRTDANSAQLLAREYARAGMAAYSKLQQREFDLAKQFSYEAVKHQRFVGTGYFDAVATVISAGQTSTCALEGSTEAEQFESRSRKTHVATNGH